MKKIYSGLVTASLILLVGACAKDTSVIVEPQPAIAAAASGNEQTQTVAQTQDYNQFQQALTDKEYKQAPVTDQAKPLMSGADIIVEPTPALETTPPTVTGQNPAVAAKAGYPVTSPQDKISKNTNIEGIDNFVTALTDTTYAKDKAVPTPGPKVLYSNEGSDITPTPETEYTPPTVTGENPEVAAKAGYPTSNIQKINTKQGPPEIDNLVSAVADTTYTKDQLTLENTPLSSKDE
ncbi:MAG TPA: hypothetical protein DD381_07980 [Lentisphaeria bacterium]|nr:MAG: hypothetical protein A2X47_04545 [Lentisphaerae bacterium GWF2_38_69]HBM16260.1 hypothetical protein [Lentisphaeria bacterium]